jgi:hypothetical protein
MDIQRTEYLASLRGTSVKDDTSSIFSGHGQDGYSTVDSLSVVMIY